MLALARGYANTTKQAVAGCLPGPTVSLAPPVCGWRRRGAGLTFDLGDERAGRGERLHGVQQGVGADDLSQNTEDLPQALVGQRPPVLLLIWNRTHHMGFRIRHILTAIKICLILNPTSEDLNHDNFSHVQVYMVSVLCTLFSSTND